MAHTILSAAYEGLSLMEYRRIPYKTEGWKVVMSMFWVPFLGIAIPFLGLLLWHTVRASCRRIEAITKEDETSGQEKKMPHLLRIKEVQTARNIVVIVVARTPCGLFRLFRTAIVYDVLLISLDGILSIFLHLFHQRV